MAPIEISESAPGEAKNSTDQVDLDGSEGSGRIPGVRFPSELFGGEWAMGPPSLADADSTPHSMRAMLGQSCPRDLTDWMKETSYAELAAFSAKSSFMTAASVYYSFNRFARLSSEYKQLHARHSQLASSVEALGARMAVSDPASISKLSDEACVRLNVLWEEAQARLKASEEKAGLLEGQVVAERSAREAAEGSLTAERAEKSALQSALKAAEDKSADLERKLVDEGASRKSVEDAKAEALQAAAELARLADGVKDAVGLSVPSLGPSVADPGLLGEALSSGAEWDIPNSEAIQAFHSAVVAGVASVGEKVVDHFVAHRAEKDPRITQFFLANKFISQGELLRILESGTPLASARADLETRTIEAGFPVELLDPAGSDEDEEEEGSIKDGGSPPKGPAEGEGQA